MERKNKMIPDILLKGELNYLEIKADPIEKLKNERAIVHYISTNNVDRVRDIMNPKGMIDDEFNKTAKSVWYNHNYQFDRNALPIGRNLWLKKKEDGVLAKTVFADTSFADDIYRLHINDFIKTWSIGFRPVYDKNGNIKETSIRIDKEKNITYWDEWNLLEYSSAPIPANVFAVDIAKDLINEIKSIEARTIIEDGLFKSDVLNQLSQLKQEFNEIKEAIDYLKATELLDVIDNNEKSILIIKEMIKKLEKKLEPIEALDNYQRFKKISSEIIGDAVRKHIKNIKGE